MDWADCKYCGSKILWRQMPQGQFLPFDPGGGKHECGAESTFIEDLYESLGSTDDEPNKSTRPTRCWWCGADVYYHTNGYGDSVLFDELGWPWQVHPCWEEHRRSQPPRRRVQLDEDDFEDMYFAPFPASDEPVGTRRRLVGFVLRQGGGYQRTQSLGHDYSSEPEFQEIEIAIDEETSYEVLLPTSVAAKIEDTAILELHCIWVAPHGSTYPSLIGTKLVAREFSRERLKEVINWSLGDSLEHCFVCGLDLARCDGKNGLEWALTEDLKPECSECKEMRGDLDIEEFIDRCKRIADNARRHRI